MGDRGDMRVISNEWFRRGRPGSLSHAADDRLLALRSWQQCHRTFAPPVLPWIILKRNGRPARLGELDLADPVSMAVRPHEIQALSVNWNGRHAGSSKCGAIRWPHEHALSVQTEIA